MIRSYKLQSYIFSNHRVTRRHLENDERFTSHFTRPMATKFHRMTAFEKGTLTAYIILHNNDVTNKKHYISISTRLVVIRLDKVIPCDIGTARTQIHKIYPSPKKYYFCLCGEGEIFLLFFKCISLKPCLDRILLH